MDEPSPSATADDIAALTGGPQRIGSTELARAAEDTADSPSTNAAARMDLPVRWPDRTEQRAA